MASHAKTLADHPNDGALLVAYANGDEAAAAVLVNRLAPRAYAQAYRMMGQQAEAEDVTQDALMKMWKVAPKWDQTRAEVSTWLYRVVANLCVDRLRQRKKRLGLDQIDEPEDGRPSVASGLQNQARQQALSEALADLPERQAEVVSLKYFEGLSNGDIAEMLELSVEAVESLAARGKRKLAQALEHRKEELGYEDTP